MKRSLLSFVLAATLVCTCLGTNFAVAQQHQQPRGDERVRKILDANKIGYRTNKNGNFFFRCDVGQGRTHGVLVESRTTRLGHLELRRVWTLAYISDTPLTQEMANGLLAENVGMKLGAWEVGRFNEKYVVVFCAKVAADADQRTLLEVAHMVTKAADDKQKVLTGKDDF